MCQRAYGLPIAGSFSLLSSYIADNSDQSQCFNVLTLLAHLKGKLFIKSFKSKGQKILGENILKKTPHCEVEVVNFRMQYCCFRGLVPFNVAVARFAGVCRAVDRAVEGGGGAGGTNCPRISSSKWPHNKVWGAL